MKASAQWVSAAMAASRLGVARATLYAYVSRGLVRRLVLRDGAHRYAAEDIERLRLRSRARRGHGAVAASALRWGEPVLDSAITAILPDGPVYRGHTMAALLTQGTTFEQVAELLWHGALPAHLPCWLPLPIAAQDGPALWRMQASLLACERLPASATGALQPGEVLATLGWQLAAGRRASSERLAVRLARAWACERHAALIDAALIVCADHELTASTFAARIAAAADASLLGCLQAALATFQGVGHGTHARQVWAMVQRLPRAGLQASLAAQVRQGHALPGVGHHAYPDGDPRFSALWQRAQGVPGNPREFARVAAYIEAAQRYGKPNLDLGLVALAAALRLPHEACEALFALGRVAGWVAHIDEQRGQPGLLRPRARYIGVFPGTTP